VEPLSPSRAPLQREGSHLKLPAKMAPLVLTLLALCLAGTLLLPPSPAARPWPRQPAQGWTSGRQAGYAQVRGERGHCGCVQGDRREWAKPRVSDQGAAFCSNLVQSVDCCPRVPPVIEPRTSTPSRYTLKPKAEHLPHPP